ncbi:MAG: efflux RND transporter periplasmic adaptor subunit, partial [Pseudomonadota bacterium]|nr:efflux RND transporter periplasmic adaptor subunit [Pseudomonadota bacterium]
ARDAIDVVATTAGQITRIAFTAGQRVAAGAVLVELDAESEQAAVREAESELQNLRRQVARARTLIARNLLSTAEADDLQAQADAAAARLAAAHNRLAKRTVKAPFAGVVGLRNVSVGDYVDTDTVLTTLDDLSVIELDFEVPERFFTAVGRGQRVTAESAAFAGRRFTGVVRDVDTRINPSTRSFRVRAELPNPDAVLPDGLFMIVSLIIAQRDDALLVPQEALVSEGGERYVFVVRDGLARRVAVQTGVRVDAGIEITAGLEADAVVVSKGHQKLRDGAPVQPLPAS